MNPHIWTRIPPRASFEPTYVGKSPLAKLDINKMPCSSGENFLYDARDHDVLAVQTRSK